MGLDISHRHSQTLCTVMTLYVTCTQMVLHMYKSLCMVFIPPGKNNLNLPMCLSFFFCLVLGWPVGKLIWLDKNIFHWRVERGLQNDFIMFYFLLGLQILKIFNLFCPLVLSACRNWKLLITSPHRPLCFKKIRATSTAAFLFSNIIALNPYSHIIAFDPQSFASLS